MPMPASTSLRTDTRTHTASPDTLHHAALRNSAATSTAEVEVRFLTADDLPALMVLEQAVWQPEQAASAGDLLERIARHPRLSIGAFCRRSGKPLASLFAKPTHGAAIRRARSWHDCVAGGGNAADDALFGISLTSLRPEGVKAIFKFFWPHALKSGWREIYLGSPVPGLRDWVRANPQRPVEDYVFATRNGLPLDPQLRYYFSKGFRRMVRVCPDYFPHADSLNYGVMLGGRIPLSALSPLWRRLPLRWLQQMERRLPVLL